MSNQIDKFRQEAERTRDRSMEREWRPKIGDRELPIRQITVHIIDWTRKLGNLGMQFAPSPGGGVWAVATFLLQVRRL